MEVFIAYSWASVASFFGRWRMRTRVTRRTAVAGDAAAIIVPGIAVLVVPSTRTSWMKPPAERRLPSHSEIFHLSSINYGEFRRRVCRPAVRGARRMAGARDAGAYR